MTETAPTRPRAGRRVGGTRLLAGLLVLVAASLVPSAGPAAAATAPVSRAAPYLALGWGDPPDPTTVMAATGVRDVTLAFVLSGKGCSPKWDGTRPLLGGTDAAAIAAVRAAGGDVSASFGGWSGRKLGTACKSPSALAGAYEAIIGAYGLHAIDIDIEHTEFTNAATRLRVVTALRRVQVDDPSVEITLTFGTTPSGPDAHGRSLLADAASVGLQPYAWTIMPFDFGVPEPDMGAVSVAAAEGLHADLMAAYGEDAATAYAHLGISSMNGVTDDAGETVGVADYQAILTYATTHHLARVTFWMLDRDRSCPTGTTPGNSCSGIVQTPWEFTMLTAGYTG